MTDEHAPSADECVGCERLVPQCEVDALAAQTHTADVVCDEGWMVPEQQWDGVAVAAVLGRAGVLLEARFLKV